MHQSIIFWSDRQANPSGADLFGSWGLVTDSGVRKPAWWSFWLFGRMSRELVATDTPDRMPATAGVWALAGRGLGRAGQPSRITVLISSWMADGGHDRDLRLTVDGLPSGRSDWEAAVYRLDGGHPAAGSPVSTASFTGTSRFILPAQSVVLVELTRTEEASPGVGGRRF